MHIQLFSETDFCRELNLMKDHIKTSETENEAIKLFIKEQFHVTKKSISDIKNEEMVNENAKLIEHLKKASQKLEQENDSRTTIIKILAKNNASKIPTAQSNTEQFKLVKRKTNHKSYKLKNERKPEIKYSNRYETLYITDSKQKKKAIAPMLNRQHLNNSSDNTTSRKKRKSKRIKTDKKNTSEQLQMETISKKHHRKHFLLLIITGQQKNPI